MRTIYTFFLLFLFGTAKLLAWGEGHIVHIDLVLDYLPTEISTFLKSETVLPAQKWGKFPDGMKKHIVQKDVVNTIGKAEAEFIDSFARSQYFWHHDNAKCMAFLLLAKAFRENNPKSASFYLGVLMHSIADMSALNHGPLLQYLTFYQYNPKAFPNVNLDINVYKESPEIRKRTKEILSDFIPDRSQKNFSDVIARLYTQSAFDSAYLSKIENKIAIEEKGKKYSDAYVETFSRLIDYQVRLCVNIICSAWNFGKSDIPLNPKDFLSADLKKMELPSDIKIKIKRILIDFSKQRKLSDDSVFEGLCDETKTPAIAFIVEKSGIMDRSAIGLKTKFLASISARYLKNSGKNIKLIDIADLKNFDLSPTKYPILVISDLTGMRFKKYIEKYVDDGGKIIIMGGKTADFSGLQQYCKTRPNNETPASTAWGVVNVEEIKKMSLIFKHDFAHLAKNEIAFKRNPNVVGWYKPVSNIEILPSPKVVPLIDLRYGDAQQTYIVSAGFKNHRDKIFAIWLPQYLLMPTLFSDDVGQDWSKPVLDSFSAPIFETCINILSEK